MILNQLRRILDKKEQNLSIHADIVDGLHVTGILEYLRLKGSIALFNPYDKIETQANKASFSAGYQECINDILGFRDVVVAYEKQTANSGKMPTADFSARSSLLERGAITPEQAAELKDKPLGI